MNNPKSKGETPTLYHFTVKQRKKLVDRIIEDVYDSCLYDVKLGGETGYLKHLVEIQVNGMSNRELVDKIPGSQETITEELGFNPWEKKKAPSSFAGCERSSFDTGLGTRLASENDW